MTLPKLSKRADLLSVLLLIVLCWLFFWRLITPNEVNQQSLVEGDFSGQFVAFAQYQAVRLGQGQVPLWDPYNYGGFPFLADTQSAVFYPPRLLTVALLNATGGPTPQRTYYALEMEMIAHTLLASLLMYALLRRLTLGQPYSIVAGLVAGITFAYGGYLTSYPQLQLAVMEAGVWLPLALLGIHEATRAQVSQYPGWRWMILAGVALGLSLMAGHPQTSLFFIYVSLAYLGYRVFVQRRSWRGFALGALIFGLVGGGLAAVQLLPGLEYSRLTARTLLSFDALGNGFPFYDPLQVVFPGFLSLWSPLYFGIAGLALALYAVLRRVESGLFWISLAALSLVLSFGQGTILFDLFYNLVPGFNLFRGQERSAYIIAVSASILAGLGTSALLSEKEAPRRYRLILWTITALMGIFAAGLTFNWLITPAADNRRLALVMFSLIIAVVAAVIITSRWLTAKPGWRGVALVTLVVFELFSFGRTNPNLEDKPVSAHLNPPPLVQNIIADKDGVYRVDGTQLLGANNGTLYGIADIQGISPLRLLSVERLLKLPAPFVWELFAVRYVPTSDLQLPVPSSIVAKQDNGPHDPINLHKLNDPRPFARLVYAAWYEPSDDKALGVLADPSYGERGTVVLPTETGLSLPILPPTDGQVDITDYQPEAISIHVTNSTPAILSIAQIYYPGWQATVDGQPATILRADTAFMALALPTGEHTVQLTFQPASYVIGAIISIVTLLLVALGGLSGLATFVIAKRRTNPEPTDS